MASPNINMNAGDDLDSINLSVNQAVVSNIVITTTSWKRISENAIAIYTDILLKTAVRELQEINYPILWGGHLARPVHKAGKMTTSQELIEHFYLEVSKRIYLIRQFKRLKAE